MPRIQYGHLSNILTAAAICGFLLTSIEAFSKDACGLTGDDSVRVERTQELESDQTPKPFPRHTETISKWWAQQQAGIDILKAEYKQANAKPSRIGVVDAGFGKAELNILNPSLASVGIPQHSHGTSVLNTLFGENFGSAANAKLTNISSLLFYDFKNRQFENRPEDVNYVDVLSISAPLTDYTDADKKAKSLAADGQLIVISAGNDHPYRESSNHLDGVAILVGATELNGKLAEYSQVSAHLTVLAPAGSSSSVQSVLPSKPSSTFTGTSFAAPLVAGAIANVVEVLGAQTSESKLQIGEVKKLLHMTSIPVTGSHCAANNAGVINAYKLYRVAQRLKQKWPLNRGIVNSESLYDFSEEAEKLRERAAGLELRNDCGAKKQIVADLRKAFALMPENKMVREKLSAILLKAGYREQALFYAPPDKSKECRETYRYVAVSQPNERPPGSSHRHFGPTAQ